MYVHKKKVGGTNPTGLVVESEVEVDSYPPVSLPSSLTFLDPFAAKKILLWAILFSYEQKPGYPPEARLIATYAKSFSG